MGSAPVYSRNGELTPHSHILALWGPLLEFVLAFLRIFSDVFPLRFDFVWVRFSSTFVDAKGLVGFVPYNLTSFLECGSSLPHLRLELAPGAAGSKLPAKESGSKLPHSKPNRASHIFWLKSRKMSRTFAAAPRENSVAGIALALSNRGSPLTCITPASVSFEGRRGPQPRKIEQPLPQGPFR